MLLRWVPHRLNDVQKKSRFSFAKIMLQKLQILQHDNLKYIATGDESLFLYFYDQERQWVLDDDEPCQRVATSHFPEENNDYAFHWNKWDCSLESKARK